MAGAPPSPTEADIERIYGRYRGLVGDWGAFVHGLQTPLPKVVWTRPGRLTVSELGEILDGMRCEPVGWLDGAVRLPASARPGRNWAHYAGLYYVQEEASLLPVQMLDAQPGHRVLDLCAAPGSKTARIAFALGNRGTVIANDRKAQRHAATSATVARLGLTNVTTVAADGITLPDGFGRFDRVLVDAPCTAEAKAPPAERRKAIDAAYRAFIANTQRALLTRAIELCRPGGRVVYSTCTFAPEENEAVLDAVLRSVEGVRVASVSMAGLAGSPPIPKWHGRRFHDDVARAVRLWPHVSGTGGFFAVAIDKLGGSEAEAASPVCGTPVTEVARAALDAPVIRGFARRFGIPDASFEGLRVLEWGQLARLVADDHVLPAGGTHVATGLTVTRNRARGPKLATAAALSLGRDATRQVVQLTAPQVERYQARASVPLEMAQLVGCETDGYVIARVGPHVVGLGLLRRGPDPLLVSEFPKAWSSAVSGGRSTVDARASQTT